MVESEQTQIGGVTIEMFYPGAALLGSGAPVWDEDAVRLWKGPSEKRYRVEQLYRYGGIKHWEVLGTSRHLTYRGAQRKVSRIVRRLEKAGF